MTSTQRLGIKSMWFSDAHLGASQSYNVGMQSEALSLMQPKQLNLLGDTIDGYEMSRNPHWTQHCEEVVQRLFWLSAIGTIVKKIAGNHDKPLRDWLDMAGIYKGNTTDHLLLRPNSKYAVANEDGPGIQLMQSGVFHNKEGAHLFAHGDEQEHIDPAKHKLVEAYDAVYYPLAKLTPAFNRLRSLISPKPYIALPQIFQEIVCKRVIDFIGQFEQSQVDIAKQAGMQGIFCGHIHYQADKVIDGIHYRNPGSMQVDQKFLIENDRGEIHKVDWGTVSLQLAASRKAGKGLSGPLDALAERIGAQRLTDTPAFSFRNPGVDEKGQSRSHSAHLLAVATYGPNYRQMPVQPAL